LAVLTSPAGNPLVGGTLSDDTGAIQYGAFQSGSENGSFTLSLSWPQINQAAPLTFMSTDHRSFVASFFAADGAKASKTVSIALTCQGVSACDGSCVDLTSDGENCGSCGHQCAYSPTSGVDTKGCQTSTCVYGVSSATLRTCSAVCAGVGMTCTDSCTGTTDAGQPVTYALAYYLSSHNVYSASCSETPPSDGDEYCCCR
jgi:hypothetical protein